MDIAFLRESFLQLLAGLPLTLELTGLAFVSGTVLALILALLHQAPLLPLRIFARIFVFVMRGTPLLVHIFLIDYGLGQFRPFLKEIGL